MDNSIKRVLMVDDDSALCEAMRDYLAERGDTYKFLGGVCTFPSAVELFKDGMPHIVILDMMLGPGLDGSDLVEEFRKIEKGRTFKTNIFVMSKSKIYENYCVNNNLMFMRKGDNNPEHLIKWIERFVDFTPPENQIIKMDVSPPKTRIERMKDKLFAEFSNVSAHDRKGYNDCVFIILKLIELTEAGESLPLEKIYEERGKQCRSTKNAIETRIRNMLSAVWKINPDETLIQFYQPYAGGRNMPTPLSFIDYYAKRLMLDYPKNVEGP